MYLGMYEILISWAKKKKTREDGFGIENEENVKRLAGGGGGEEKMEKMVCFFIVSTSVYIWFLLKNRK